MNSNDDYNERKQLNNSLSYTPEFIINFIIEFLKNKNTNHILNINANFHYLIKPILKFLKFEKLVALSASEISFGKEDILSLKENIELLIGDYKKLVNNIQDFDMLFDVIVSFFPLIPGLERIEFGYKDELILIKDTYENVNLLQSSLMLKEEGHGIFIVRNSFFSLKEKNRVNTNLEKFGLFVDSIFPIESKLFPSNCSLIIVKKQEPEYTFVGILTENERVNKTILNNLEVRKEGRLVELGTLVHFHKYYSIERLKSESDIEDFTETRELKKYNIESICLEINLAKRSEGWLFEDRENVVYLPNIGKSNAVDNINNLQLKNQNYIQLVLDEKLAIASFIARFFNTSFGQILRDTYYVGTVIPKISKNSLRKAIIYIPYIEQQREIIRLDNILLEEKNKTELMQKNLWEELKPDRAKITPLKQGKDFHDELELYIYNLPYPISSILRYYYTEDESKEKYENLLSFFEAFTQFLAIILVSCFSHNLDFYKQYSSRILRNFNFKRPGFNDWLNVCNEISLIINNYWLKKNPAFISKLFGNPDGNFVKILIDPKLYHILSNVKDIRNSWKGHGGKINKTQADNLVTILEINLAEFRDVIENFFTYFDIITPISLVFQKGIYECKVDILKGCNMPFKKERFELLNLLEKTKLYFLPKDQNKAIKLLPLMKIIRAPNTSVESLYYFNKRLNGKIRWISFHSEEKAEVINQDSETIDSLKYLNRREITSL